MSAPDWAVAELATLDTRHCRCLAVSPDGTAIAIIGGDALSVREIQGAVIWSRPFTPPTDERLDLMWSPRADRLYVLADRRLVVHHADVGDVLELPDAVSEHEDLTALALSTDGRMLALGTNRGLVLVHDRNTGTVTDVATGDRVTALVWHPRELELCVAQPRSLQFWNLPAKDLLRTVGTRNLYSQRLAWSPDAKLIAVAGVREVLMVDAQSRHELDVLEVGRSDSPVAVEFTRDGSHLLVGFADSVEVVDRQLVLVRRLPADLVASAALHVGDTGLVAARINGDHVRLWAFPDTEQPPAAVAATASLRRWAAKTARTVGRNRADAGDGHSVAARESVLAEPDGHRWGPGFAWTPDGGSYYRETAPGRMARLKRSEPGRSEPDAPVPLWEHDVDRIDGGVLDVEVSAGAGRFLALAFRNTASRGGFVDIMDAATGQPTSLVPGGQAPAWSPTREDLLAIPSSGEKPEEVWVYRIVDGSPVGQPERLAAREGVVRLAWSPDGALLAAASRQRAVVWDTTTWQRVTGPTADDPRVVFGRLAWSPNGQYLACCPVTVDVPVVVYDTRTWRVHRVLGATSGPGWAPAVAWSPDSAVLAFPGASGVELWDVLAERRIRTLPAPEGTTGSVWANRWSPDGTRLVTSYGGGLILNWDLHSSKRPENIGADTDLPIDVLTALGVTAARVRVAAPLSLLSDLLELLRGTPKNHLSSLAGHRGVAAVRALRWPVAALIGVAVLLAADLPADDRYPPPEGAGVDQLSLALGEALGVASAHERPELPMPELMAVLDGIDDRLLTLLTLLGAESVVADPTLPSRLRHLRHDLWPLSIGQRRLIGLRLQLLAGGRAQGGGIGGARAGVARHGNVNSLLPTQLALPELLSVRQLRDELLYRTREGTPPPVSRGTVLVMDDTPAAHGQVGVTLRCIAHLLARTLLERRHRCGLVSLGDPAQACFLTRQVDLTAIWTLESLHSARVGPAFQMVAAMAAQLADPLTGAARVVLFTHKFLIAPPYPDLLTVRVYYPGQPVQGAGPGTFGLAAQPTAEALTDVVIGLLTAA